MDIDDNFLNGTTPDITETIHKLDVDFIQIVVSLHAYFNDYHKISDWLYCVNPQLGGAMPIDLILRGRGHKVLQFINAMLEENQEG